MIAGRRLGRDERGQALVEFALVVPFILLLLISVWEFGRAWNVQQVITDAAREGARVAAVGNGNPAKNSTQLDADVRAAVNTALSVAAISPTDATITLSGIKAGRDQAAVVAIQVPYQFVFLGPVLDLVGHMYGGSARSFGSTITLNTSFSMKNE